MTADDLPISGLHEYSDAEQYDLDNTWGEDDDFYLALAQEIGGPVLDAGCGTGRLTRAIAEAGIEAVGLDITPAMLERARQLSAGLDVEWVLGDACTVQLGRRFRLVLMTGHAFQHLLTDADIGAFFDRAREHLLDGGYLAFETRNYAVKTYGRTEEPEYWRTTQDPHGRWIDTLVGGRYDPATGIEDLEFVDVVQETGERTHSTSTMRYISADDLNALLEAHGFFVIAQYGDWDRGPLDPLAPEIITIAETAVLVEDTP